jgi:dsDNA-specific endonuclease/ATPase MutS2
MRCIWRSILSDSSISRVRIQQALVSNRLMNKLSGTEEEYMYNQQEIEMVRRQTIQIETEKRALLKMVAIWTSIACAVGLAIAGIFFYLYASNRSEVTESREKIAQLENQLKKNNDELQKKTAELEQRAQVAAARKQQYDTLLSKALSSSASYTEMAQLAKEIYESPQKAVEVARVPPSSIFKWYKYRENNKTYTYALVPGQIEGKYYINSILISVTSPPPKL